MRTSIVLGLILASCGGSPSTGGSPDAPGSQITVQRVGAAGGSVSAAAGAVELDFPAGALAGDVDIRVEPAAAPAGAVGGTAFSFSPGQLFLEPVRLVVRYDPAAIPASTNPADLTLFGRAEGGLAMPIVGAAVDAAAHTISADVVHFSTYYVGPYDSRVHGHVEISGSPATNVTVSWTGPNIRLVRAYHGPCPPGLECPPPCPVNEPMCDRPPDAAHHYGCSPDDFSFDDDKRPNETSIQCFSGGTPSCAPIPSPRTDYAPAAGFYCYAYLVGDEVVPLGEVYSFGQGIPPPAVTGLSALPRNDGNVQVQWQAVPASPGDYLLLGYYLVRSGASAETFQFPPTALEFIDTHVEPEQTYSYYVFAFSAAGYGPGGPSVSVTTIRPPADLPGLPPAFTAAPTSRTSIALSWQAAARAQSYRLTRTSPGPATPIRIPTGQLSAVDTGLTAGTTYTYELHAENFIGLGPAATAMASTPTGPDPTCPGGVALTLSPTSVGLGPGETIDIGLMVQRIDAGANLTVSAVASEPITAGLNITLPSPNPFTGNTATLRLAHSNQPVSGMGTVSVRVTDGTTFGSCTRSVSLTIFP